MEEIEPSTIGISVKSCSFSKKDGKLFCHRFSLVNL
jgi:hypothetical protein